MLRDKNLIPLSHQHQHALALCVRIDRAQPIQLSDLHAWREEIERDFADEIEIHFSAEESALFPMARQFAQLIPLIEELVADHAVLREWVARTRTMSAADLAAFGRQLSDHIRKEERQLFERLQQLLTPSQLAGMGRALEDALRDADRSCSLPNEATRLKPRTQLG